jgi:hypothetical protein
MQFNLIDFFIGFTLMNAMPHLLMGLFRIRFLSLFGFSHNGNLAYGSLNVFVALMLFHIQYGLNILIDNGILIGALVIIVLYLITGRYLYKVFQKKA